MAHGCGVDREFDVTEGPLARLDAVDEVTVDIAASGVTGDRLRGAFLIGAHDLQVSHARVLVVNKLDYQSLLVLHLRIDYLVVLLLFCLVKIFLILFLFRKVN